MRFTEIDKPKGLLLKVAYYLSKKQFGKVLTVFKVIYARSTPVLQATIKIIRTEEKLSISKSLRQFIRYYTSHLNDCPFCANTNAYQAAKDKNQLQEWKEFMNYRGSQKFSEKEKALLAYLEEVNLTKTAADGTFAELTRHFSEKEIVEITWLNAVENYFNLMAKPLQVSSDNLTTTPSPDSKWDHNNF